MGTGLPTFLIYLRPTPLKANIIKYKIIIPHKLKLVTIYYKQRHYPPVTRKQGFSLSTRFVLRYHNIDSIAMFHSENKIPSKVFKDKY
jgi:hypothetical protein